MYVKTHARVARAVNPTPMYFPASTPSTPKKVVTMEYPINGTMNKTILQKTAPPRVPGSSQKGRLDFSASGSVAINIVLDSDDEKKLLAGRCETLGSIVLVASEGVGLFTKASPTCARMRTAVKPRNSMLRNKEVVMFVVVYCCVCFLKLYY